jgi:hypothetical protein
MVTEERAKSGDGHGVAALTAFERDEQVRAVRERPFQP